MGHEFGKDIKDEYFIHGRDTKKVSKALENAITGHNWTRLEKPEDGCAVAMSTNKIIHHCGIFVQRGILHATDGSCVVFNHLKHLKLAGYKRIEFYRWLG